MPVIYFGGLIVCIEPVSALMLHIGSGLLSIWIAIHVLIYTAAFLGIGSASYAIIRRIPSKLAREFSVVALLTLPIWSSFARVITYSSLQGRGGTYNFWEAVDRYVEKRH
ncbi:hypothetical protein [Luteolibacter arcticus]|uniref:hypothetical protein n=1 Tax=Luteolibacter arcticus TaxID=1581411 RepID=UPI00222168FA|nr:hypothetical protein [Luteolibacter arcticus]